MIRIITLGTAGMAPTRTRSLLSIFMEYYKDCFLFDVGENTQRQLLKAGINRNRISYILISHWHADHTSGLPGLLHTMNANKANKEIVIMGPKGTKKHINNLKEAFEFKENGIGLRVIEASSERPKKIFETKEWEIWAVKGIHGVEVNAYSFIEKDQRVVDKNKLIELLKKGLKPGKWIETLKKGRSVRIKGETIRPQEYTRERRGRKISFVVDTLFSPRIVELVKDSDILISEAMFLEKDKEKAKESLHLTAREAAEIAKQSHSKKLILVHSSQRYKNKMPLLNEAKKIFPTTFLPKDLDAFILEKA